MRKGRDCDYDKRNTSVVIYGGDSKFLEEMSST